MDIRMKQRAVVEALENVKGRDILVFNTARLPSMFERVVIASGDSHRQVKALARNVREKVEEAGGDVIGVEGEESGEWVLVDLGARCPRHASRGAHLLQPGGNLGRQARAAKRSCAQQGETACQGSTSSP
jgi:ribosome silencing factor RsfS/YbeB/iojap